MRALRVGLGAPSGPFRETARSHGIVLTFLSEIRSVFVTAPPGYSAAAVERVRRSYEPTGLTPRARSGGVSLVIYLVESLMDPNDLGLRYTSEPMPNFRSIAAEQIHGRAVVPFEYYGSAETEFELLTGMSMAFLPAGSIPFRQYVRRPLPALPRMLHDLGYATIAVQAGPRTFYDRERVEPLLGFDRTIWPYGAPGVARADRGRWPSDDVIVDSVIAASEGPRPFFIFAFPASMHSPYHSGTYARADLDVRDAPTPAAAAEVKEYINAVRVADRAIGHLVEHFRGARDSVVIAIMGDHLPPFSSDVLALFTRRLARLPTAARARATRATPMLVWANFSLPPGEITLSTNMLPGYLLERVGAPGRELFALTDSLRRALPVTSAVAEANDGRLWLIDSVPPPLRRALADYRVLQYDILLGHRFSQGWKTLAASAAPRTTP